MNKVSFKNVGLKYTLNPDEKPVAYIKPGETIVIETEDACSGQIRKKGDIPMNSGAPFYTTSQNPQTKDDVSCLANMQEGDSCTQEWTVIPNGVQGNTYEFFTYYDSTVGGDNTTQRVNITIYCDDPDGLPAFLIHDTESPRAKLPLCAPASPQSRLSFHIRLLKDADHLIPCHMTL